MQVLSSGACSKDVTPTVAWPDTYPRSLNHLAFPYAALHTQTVGLFTSARGYTMQHEKKPNQPESFSPVGTWILLCLVAIAMAAAWLFLYFGVFLPRGTVQ